MTAAIAGRSVLEQIGKKVKQKKHPGRSLRFVGRKLARIRQHHWPREQIDPGPQGPGRLNNLLHSYGAVQAGHTERHLRGDLRGCCICRAPVGSQPVTGNKQLLRRLGGEAGCLRSASQHCTWNWRTPSGCEIQ